MRSWLLAVTLSFSALAPQVAFADEPSPQDIAQARQLGMQAQQAYEAGNYQEADKLFTAACKLYSVAPTLTLGLARTHAKLGKFVAAQEGYNKIIREWSTHPSPPPAFKDALESARNEVGAVSAHVASVVITVEGPENPQVTIDGEKVPAATLGLKRPVDPGQHVVKVVADKWKPAESSFTVADAGSAEVKLKPEKAPDAPAAVAGAPANDPSKIEPPPPAAQGGSSNKTLAIVALGVGGAGLAVGAITGVIALGKHGDLNDKCPGGTCPASAQSDVDGYKSMGTISTIGFIVGGVGVAAGAVLWFTAPKSTGEAKSSNYATINPYVGVGSAGVTGRF